MSGGGREQRREGEEQGRRGWRKIDRERGKLQRRYPDRDIGQYTAHKTTHNAALAIATLVGPYYKYKIVNGYISVL